MSFFTANTNAEQAAKDEGGSYINESGIYSLTIKTASVNVSKGGATEVVMAFEGKEGSCTVYGLRITNNDGTASFMQPVFNALLITLGLDGVDSPVPETHKFGDKEVELNVLQDLTDKEVKVWLQKEWTQYNGAIRGNLRVKRFYEASTGKTHSEILNGLEATKLAKDEAYSSTDKYKDGLTKETAIATPKGEKSATTETAKPAANPFAK